MKFNRTQEAQEKFEKHMDMLKKKYPQVKNWLSAEAIPHLVEEGVKISSRNFGAFEYFVMDTGDFAYEGAVRHYVIYLANYTVDSESPEPTEHEKTKSHTATRHDLITVAGFVAKDEFFNKDVVVVAKTKGTFDVPHVHLIETKL